mgnify:CR=1 FL=1
MFPKERNGTFLFYYKPQTGQKRFAIDSGYFTDVVVGRGQRLLRKFYNNLCWGIKKFVLGYE